MEKLDSTIINEVIKIILDLSDKEIIDIFLVFNMIHPFINIVAYP